MRFALPFLLAVLLSSSLFAQPVCSLSNFNSVTTLAANAYPYTSPTSGITVNATTVSVPTLNNFTYNCGGQPFATVAPAWWINSAAGTITLTFSVPVTNFSVVVNGTNIGEEFYFASNNGPCNLSNYCTAGFLLINGGSGLRCNISAATGTLIGVNNPAGATVYTLTHSGTGSGSRYALLDCFTGGTVLPVEILDFDAELVSNGSRVQLDWATGVEENSQGFEVQHSMNGTDWENIDFVPSNGSSNQEYQRFHNEPSMGFNMYRLRQLDMNGEFRYSDVRTVMVDDLPEGLTVFPNPSNGRFEVLGQNIAGNLTIVDVLGKVIAQHDFENHLELNLDNQAKGIYFVRIDTRDGQRHTSRMVIR